MEPPVGKGLTPAKAPFDRGEAIAPASTGLQSAMGRNSASVIWTAASAAKSACVA
jgi:hypothetical protein